MSIETETLPEILVAIPDTVATHILGESAMDLGKGDLTVVLTESTGISAPSAPAVDSTSHTPILTLTVGKAAFPLYKTTMFGTLADDVRAYVFAPEIGGERGGYVKVTLPEGVQEPGSAFEKLQTKLEQVLIRHGLLKEGIEAATDELGKSMQEDSARYLADNPPTESPMTISNTVHSVTASSESGTQDVASAAHRMSTAVSSAASHAGAWMLHTLSGAHGSTVDGYSAGSAEVDTAAGQQIGHAYGKEPRAVTSDAGASVQNVGVAVDDVIPATGGAMMTTGGLHGAAGAHTKPQEVKERLDGDDEEAWNDVFI